MKHYIYTIRNILNNKIYVGQTKNPDRRWSQHQYDAFVRGETWTRLYYSMRKYGVDNFIYTIIENYDLSDIDAAEIHWITKLNTTDRKIGYNQEGGGSVNKIVSDDTRKKMGNARRGKRHTNETRQRISIAKKGRKATDEQRAQMSSSRKGRIHSEETRKKMSESAKKVVHNNHTDEAKQKMSEQRRGENNVRAKLRDVDIPVIMNLHNEGKSNIEIARLFNVSNTAIWRIVSGRGWKRTSP